MESKRPSQFVKIFQLLLHPWPSKTGKDFDIIEKVWSNTTVLAEAISEKEEIKGSKHAAFWINTYDKAKVFGTTFGHGNATFEDPVFMDTVTRGLLWACGKLGDDGEVIAGYEAAPGKKKKKKKK